MSSSNDRQPAVVSIHDVMPETLEQVQYCLDECHRHDLHDVYLLVVPGRNWQPQALRRLQGWLQQGGRIVAHGWLHHCESIEGPYHRLHSALISRNVAEHLMLDGQGISDLMRRSRQWFASQDLPTPSLYVPPAWALGGIDNMSLKQTGFDYVETVRGVRDVQSGHWRLGPLLGYEADDLLRRRVLSVWNRANRRMAGPTSPLRIGIHPHDPQLLLSEELQGDLRDCRSITLESVFAESPQTVMG